MAALILIAGSAMAVQFAGERTVDVIEGRPAQLIPDRADFVVYIWPAARALVRSGSAKPFYGSGRGAVYPPQFVVLMAPFGLVDGSAARVLSVLLTALLVVVVALAWSRDRGQWRAGAIPLLLAAPAVMAVRLDHTMSVVGLAALTAAIFAHRRGRWYLFGMASAVALCRPANAIPVVVMMGVAIIPRPLAFLRAALGGALVLGLLTLVAYAWDPTWPADYQASIRQFHLVGFVRLAEIAFGSAASYLLIVLLSLPAAVAGWRNRDRALDLDRVSLLMAATVVIANGGGLYVAVFCLPAALRLSLRPAMALSAWVFATVPWLAILALSPVLLSNDPGRAAPYISAMALTLPLAALPLLRRPRGALESLPPSRDSSVGRAAV